MTIELGTPTVDELGTVVRALRDWQGDASPVQLHPGDLGWFWQFGAEATARAVRTWSRDGQVLAVALLDGPDVLRLTTAPEARRDEPLVRRLLADVTDPERGVLPAGTVSVETPNGSLVQEVLTASGWELGEPWAPLRRDLGQPVQEPDLRIEVVGPEQVSAFTAVHRSAWGSPKFTDERWHTMAGGSPYADARSLLGYDGQGVPVAGVIVWSAGAGRPGLLEPMGVHADHRGRGHGTAIVVAAAAELRTMGASSALVCTEGARTGAIATYVAAGFERLPSRLDRSRSA
ncbi:MAG TPA: GNAT family N-acetyltransferase [Kineosporiaceae bacterium]|nr:GNAT family N-acetyltransferase [Kineosporiaceae bacterium]